jgi:hypothetical protein
MRILHCLRSPFEVAASLSVRAEHYVDFQAALTLWMDYHSHLLRVVQPEQWIVTHYESYFYDPCVELRRVLTFLGLEVSDDLLERVAALVKPGLQRNFFPRVSQETPLPDGLLQRYQTLCDLAGPVFARSIADLPYRVDLLESRIHSLHTHLVTARARLRQRDGEIARQQGIIAEQGTQIHELQQQVSAEQKKVEAEQRQVKVEQQKAEAEKETRRALEVALEEVQAEIGAMRATRGWRTLERWWKLKRNANIRLQQLPGFRGYYLARTALTTVRQSGLSELQERLAHWRCRHPKE